MVARDSLKIRQTEFNSPQGHLCQICEVCNSACSGLYCSQSCAHFSQRKVEHPTKEQLAQDIANLSWVRIGKKYGVSDKAIRKWARKYELI